MTLSALAYRRLRRFHAFTGIIPVGAPVLSGHADWFVLMRHQLRNPVFFFYYGLAVLAASVHFSLGLIGLGQHGAIKPGRWVNVSYHGWEPLHL
ncbi:MAG TPA: hypothetical protein VGQ24_09495 [Gemmatimonadales bacterium]|nr:hypothetical protein [Gemmatimonadales bacterium]